MTTPMVQICTYAGAGNVLKIQKYLHLYSEHYEPPSSESESSLSKKDAAAATQKEKEDKEKDLSGFQSVTVLGIALMAFRSFGNLLCYCEPCIRGAFPLSLGLISVSNPKLNILDMLSKFSHDSDTEVAHNSIFYGIGQSRNQPCTIGHRRLAMLRQLAQYHAKDPNNLFMVRIAQRLTNLGKGTLSLSHHSDRLLMSPIAVARLIATLVSFMDVRNIILGKSLYIPVVHAGHCHAAMNVHNFHGRLESIPGSRSRWYGCRRHWPSR